MPTIAMGLTRSAIAGTIHWEIGATGTRGRLRVDASVGGINVIELTVPWLPGRINGVVLWPVILYRQGWRSPCVEEHERYHWRDIRRWGVIPWYAVYLVLLPVFGGGRRHPLERNAYRVEQQCRGS